MKKGAAEPSTTASSKPDFKLQTLYLNARRLTELAGEAQVQRAMSVATPAGPYDKLADNVRMGALGRVLRAWLIKNWNKVEPLERLLLTGKAKVGDLFTTERDFHCRNLAPRVRPSKVPPQLTAKYELADRDVTLVLKAHRDHLAPGSAGEWLTGRRGGLFVVGVIKRLGRTKVEASPVFVGFCISPSSDAMFLSSPAWYPEIQVERIDNFSKCGAEEFVRDRELKKLQQIPEAKIKKAMAELIGEDNVPKDWGGERSDLFSTRLCVDGQRVSVAFAFKGPAKFHPMKLSDLGANGDQIDRLFTEPAQLLILQHCHRVTAGVRNMLKAYATRHGDLRRFCVIDGCDTLRILRAYGKCGQKSKPMRPRRRREPEEPFDEYPEFDV
jgi:hypothetical protein